MEIMPQLEKIRTSSKLLTSLFFAAILTATLSRTASANEGNQAAGEQVQMTDYAQRAERVYGKDIDLIRSAETIRSVKIQAGQLKEIKKVQNRITLPAVLDGSVKAIQSISDTLQSTNSESSTNGY